MVANTYSDRLQLALNDSKTSISALAAAMGVSYHAVRKVLKGESNAFTAENNAKAARILGVRANWLAANEAPMKDTSTDADQLTQQAVRNALRTLRNQLVHGHGAHNDAAGAALALLAKVPDSDRAYDEAIAALLAIAQLPVGDVHSAGMMSAGLTARALTLATRFDALGAGPLQGRAYSQMVQVLERAEEEKAAAQQQPTAAPPAGQSPSPAGAR